MKEILGLICAIAGVVYFLQLSDCAKKANAQTQRIAYAQYQNQAPVSAQAVGQISEPASTNTSAILETDDIKQKVALAAPLVLAALRECPEPIPPAMITGLWGTESGYCAGKPTENCAVSSAKAVGPTQCIKGAKGNCTFSKSGEDPETLADAFKQTVRHLCFAKRADNGGKIDPSSDIALMRYHGENSYANPSTYVKKIRSRQAQHEAIFASLANGNGPMIASTATSTGGASGGLDSAILMSTELGKILTVGRRHGVASPVGIGNTYTTSVAGEGREGHIHQGVDFAGPTGEPVFAIFDGIVEVAGWNHATPAGERAGVHVRIKHNTETKQVGKLASSGSMHLNETVVRVGDRVVKGQLIGYIGSTGIKNSGAHLHFQVERWNANGQMEPTNNPFLFIDGSAFDPAAGDLYKGPPKENYAKKFGSLASKP